MAESSIEWTDATWNPTTGCTRASAGCDHCYAFTMTKRLAAMGQEKYQGLAGTTHFNGVMKTHDDELAKPLRWKKPRMVFVNSMSDLFHKDVPFEFIDRVFAVMYETHWHTYQVLTKRPERMAEYLSLPNRPRIIARAVWRQLYERDPEKGAVVTPKDLCEDVSNNWPLPNVWLGTSVENQETFEERVPHLLQCPAVVRFLSCEPLLGPLCVSRYVCNRRDREEITPGAFNDWEELYGNPLIGFQATSMCSGTDGGPRIHWLIVGGESGPYARPFNIEWARYIVRQCRRDSVPCFVKQLGSVPFEDDSHLTGAVIDRSKLTRLPGAAMKDKKGGDPAEWPEDLRVREFPKAEVAT